MGIFGLSALEWHRLRRDRIFWTVTGLCAIALCYGLGNGFAWMHFQQRAIQRAETIAREKLREAKTKAVELNRDPGRQFDGWSDPRSAIGFEGVFLRLHDCLEPVPLAMAGVGQSDLLPYCVRVATGPWPTFLASYEWENPLRLLLGRFDCAFVLIYLLPLLVVVICFNLLSRERELGTLPLLFSYPISPQRWLAVGFLVRASLFLGVTLSTLTLSLFLGGFDPTTPGALPRLALWLALIVAYGGFWFGLAWLVNARGGSSASNALTLVIVWLGLVMVLPACLNMLVKQLYPLPSRVEFINAIRDTTERAEKQGSTLLKK
ncbi:MAG: ABC transporter permease [Methylococcales bacterium]